MQSNLNEIKCRARDASEQRIVEEATDYFNIVCIFHKYAYIIKSRYRKKLL